MAPSPGGELELAGARALVTGASSGIGLEISRCLARRGIGELVLVARRRNRLEALAGELAAAGTTCTVDAVDLSDPDQVAGLVARQPRVDLLVGNAGFGWGLPFAQGDSELQCRMVDVNCRALVQLCRAWVPGMAERGWGGVLLVGSAAGYVPIPAMAVYSASKAFVHAFSEGLRAEVGSRGVRVHLLAPGPVATEFSTVARPGARRTPVALSSSPRRVAEEGVEAWLAGEPERIPGAHVRWGVRGLRVLPDPFLRALRAAAFRRLEAALGRRP